MSEGDTKGKREELGWKDAQRRESKCKMRHWQESGVVDEGREARALADIL